MEPVSYTHLIDFIPAESGTYEVDIKVKDEFSSRPYDASTSLFIDAKDYICLLYTSRTSNRIGD